MGVPFPLALVTTMDRKIPGHVRVVMYDFDRTVAVNTAMHPTGRHPIMLAVSVIGARDIGHALSILAGQEMFPQVCSSILTWRVFSSIGD